jgi:PAS domain S-box-containing protein
VTQNLPENLAGLDLSSGDITQGVITLLNLIPDPVFIFDRSKDKILAANNALFLLTHLGESDFINQSISSLLPDTVDSDPISGHDKKTFLRHKNQPLIPATIRIFSLTKDQMRVLILLKPQNINPPGKSANANQSELLEKLTSLYLKRENQDLKTSLISVLREAEKILNADVVCVYKKNTDNTEYLRYLSSNTEFGSQLPKGIKKDHFILSERGEHWNSEIPAANPLLRSAAGAGFKFLTVVPLVNAKTDYGLFVAGSKKLTSDPSTLPLTHLIAAYFSGLMEDQVALHNLQNLASRIKQVVKIQGDIINNLEEGVIILSPDLTIAEFNPSAEALLGYANVEALRQPIDSIMIGSESLRSALASAQQGIPTLTGGDLKLHHRNGNSFPAQVMMVPVITNTKLLAIIILIRDISLVEQSRAAKNQLEQRAILGEVTAIFAHEVRNPINAIMLSLQVVEDNLEEGDENRKWIENMREECNKLMYLMDSVLSFAKPLEYKMSGVDLDYLINHILERWHPRFIRLNITSYYESELKRPVVEGDLRALEQVFTNLISNAANAMSDNGGSLGIKISQPDQIDERNFVVVTVTDSGHGIPDDIKAHLFKPFVTGSTHGTGLGLAITQRIINAHKGKIEVESFTGGTIFKIYLLKKKGFSEQ